MARLQFHFLFSALFVLAFGVISWLVMSESSPFREYFLWHVELPNLLRWFHLGPAIIGIMLSGNVHQPSTLGFFTAAVLQWFMVGFLLSFVLTGFKARREKNAV